MASIESVNVINGFYWISERYKWLLL